MIQPLDFFVIRRPVFPVDSLHSLYQLLRSNPNALPDILRTWFSAPLQQQALETASPQLVARVQRWLAGETLSDEAKLINTLHKYLIRMTTRSTPYGLFAGCALGTIGDTTLLQAGSPETIAPHVRLDIDYLQSVKDWLLAKPDLRRQLRVSTNSTLYQAGNFFRFIEQQLETTGRTYFISAVGADDLLTDLFVFAQQGVTTDELIAFLHSSYQVTPDDAAHYVSELIDSQLLVFELEPSLTGDAYLTTMQKRLADLNESPSVCYSQQVIDDINQLLATRPLQVPALSDYLAEQGIAKPGNDLVQIDTAFPNDQYQLSERWLKNLQRQLNVLMVLNQPFRSNDLDDFQHRFYTRYEEEEVPLALALDHEMGIGYGSNSALGVGSAPMIDSLSLPGAVVHQAASLTDWQSFVLNRYTEALRYGQGEIVLTDADLRHVGDQSNKHLKLPTSCYAFGTVLASSAQTMDADDYLFVLSGFKGPSAVNLMSRFGESDPVLAERIKACARQDEESHPDVILAEIVHFPESRAGNILVRPTLHRYEIPYLGRASVAPDFQIPLSDLYLSVRNDRLILRSKRLNKRVIPRLSNAHNFQGGLPVYQFLCNLQYQDAYLDLRWNWGLLAQQVYLPRVRYNNIVVSRATWQITAKQFDLNDLSRLRDQLNEAGLPHEFLLVHGDNELRIDTSIDAAVHLLVHELRRTNTVRLVECLQTPDRCPVRGPGEQAFTHELILPFRNPSALPYAPIDTDTSDIPQRRFSVGSEWLYLKIYAGEKASDSLLVDALYPAIKELVDQKIVQKFFFIRYKDQDPHLRLRFHGNPFIEFYHYVIRRIERALQPYVQSGVVHKIQTDTYQRELERYGIKTMTTCEDFFHHDSLSTLQFMSQTGDSFDENLRFAFAAHKVDRLLKGMNMPTNDCHTLLNRLRERFFVEFNGDATLRQQLNERYRSYKPLLEQALSRPFPLANGMEHWVEQQQPFLNELDQPGQCNPSIQSLAASLIHMTVNRLFPSKQRAYELVLYHCLAKYYDSQRARQRTEAGQLTDT
ncbi:lantibiotic dehydratase [Spirosoma agri]|uniref:Lantibiotic dehydratase n=1 Tax=Spirosoma agri TaxID=1987381 RepID=A0A6M0INZ7_9BACT|nr:lantibiotic dehydratase [Spirosoma agri]NEU69774.1 lantibiotic dehydratase [Spirosoma agri]